MSETNKFKLSLIGGAININEQEISSDVAAKIVRLMFPLVDDSGTSLGSEDDHIDHSPINPTGNKTTVKQFMAQKQPKSDIERITCLAYYLTHSKQQSQFKTVDLTHLNVEAAQPKLSNPSFTARNAVSQQYLAPAGGGRKQITERGEVLVAALPDRSAVKNALEKYPMHGNRKKRVTKNKK